MGWRLMETPKTQKVTKRLAEMFATMEPPPRERPLREHRIQVYTKLMAEGNFRPITWAAAYCKETAGTYRVNGQHTSTIISGYDESPLIYVTMERYECDTLEDVGRLYATFDSKMQSRTASDIYLSFASTVGSLQGIPQRNIGLAVAGMSYVIEGDKGHKNSQAADRAERLLENPEFVLWLDGILGGTLNGQYSNRHLKRTGTAAAMFATYQRTSREATKFWEEVRDETATTPTAPTRKLSRYLLMNFGTQSNLTRKPGSRIADREVYVRCLHAWNAWRKNEPTDLRYYPAAELPDVR